MAKPVIRCRMEFHGGTDYVKKFGLEPGGRVQKAIDFAALNYAYLYEPRREGAMHRNAVSATNYGSGEVIYPGPYAHYQYKGEVYGPNIPIYEDNTGIPTKFVSPKNKSKHPTGRALKYTRAGAQSFWWEKMKENHAQDILRLAAKAAVKGEKG